MMVSHPERSHQHTYWDVLLKINVPRQSKLLRSVSLRLQIGTCAWSDFPPSDLPPGCSRDHHLARGGVRVPIHFITVLPFRLPYIREPVPISKANPIVYGTTIVRSGIARNSLIAALTTAGSSK